MKSKSFFWYKITVELHDEAKTSSIFLGKKVKDIEVRNNQYDLMKKKYPKSGKYECDLSTSETNKVVDLVPVTEKVREKPEKPTEEKTKEEIGRVKKEQEIPKSDGEDNINKDNETHKKDKIETQKTTKPTKSEDKSKDEKKKKEDRFMKDAKKKMENEKKAEEAAKMKERMEEKFNKKKKKKDEMKRNQEEQKKPEKKKEETPKDTEKKEVEKIKEILKKRKEKREEDWEGSANQKLKDIFKKRKKKGSGEESTSSTEDNFIVTYFKNFYNRFLEVKWTTVLWVFSKLLFGFGSIAVIALFLRIALITRYKPTPPLINGITAEELHERIVNLVENYEIPKIKPIESTYDRGMSDFFDKHEYDRYITKKVNSKRTEELILLKYLIQNDCELIRERFEETPYLFCFDTLNEPFEDDKKTNSSFRDLMESEKGVHMFSSSLDDEKCENFGIGTSLLCVLWNGLPDFVEKKTLFSVVKLEYIGSQIFSEQKKSKHERILSHNPFHKRSKRLSFSKKEKDEYDLKRVRRKKNRILEHTGRFLAEMGLYLSCLSQSKDPIHVEILSNHNMLQDFHEFRYRQLGAIKFENLGQSRGRNRNQQQQHFSIPHQLDEDDDIGEIWGSKRLMKVQEEEDDDEDDEVLSSTTTTTTSSTTSGDSLMSVDDHDSTTNNRQRRDSLDETLDLEVEQEEEEDELLRKKLQQFVEESDDDDDQQQQKQQEEEEEEEEIIVQDVDVEEED